LASNPPNDDIKQVLEANSPLTNNVASYLAELNIPNHLREELLNAQTGVSAMQELMVEISAINRQRELLLNRVISNVVLDTLIDNPMEIVADLLAEEDSRRRREERCDAIICQGDENEFNNARNEFDALFQDNNYTNVAEIELGIRLNQVTLSDTSNTQFVGALETISLDPSDISAASRAEAMLDAMFDKRRFPIVEKLVFDGSGKSINNQEQEPITKYSLLKLYPNPTNGQEITLELIEELENPRVFIYNAMGQLITKQTFAQDTNKIMMDTHEFEKGIYFVEIQSNSQVKEHAKFIVQ
jgi:hypothetical protein